MRPREEIECAIAHLKDALLGGILTEGMNEKTRAIAALMQALQWTLGDARPGGFGEMLAELAAVDEHAARVKNSAEVN